MTAPTGESTYAGIVRMGGRSDAASWRSAPIVVVAVNGRPIGALLLADKLRADTPQAIRPLRDAGIEL